MLDKKINRNFSFLTLLNLITMLFPILLYPILIASIGLDKLGQVIFIQAIVAYFSVLVSYGFNITGTKLISTNLDDKEEVRNIFWSIFFWKLSIFVILGIIAVIFIPSNLTIIFYICYSYILYDVFFPVWYYQGKQTMGKITMFNALVKLIIFLMVVTLVKEKSDYYLYAIIVSLTPSIFSIVNFLLLVKKEELGIKLIHFNFFKDLIISSTPIFLSTVSSAIKDRTNVVMIGLFVGHGEVVIYDFVIKVINILSGIFANLTNAQFPELSKKKNSVIRIFKNYMKVICVSNFIIVIFALLIVCNLELIVNAFNISNVYSSDVLLFKNITLILLPVIFVRSISYQVGLGVLIINGKDREYTLNLIMSTLIFISINAILYFSESVTTITLSISLLLTVSIELVHRIYLCHRFKLINWLI
ncbi:oligosaccharide flippase family protein [Vibrio parahaemolyticus]|uniref:oligosaccharide flippase family protein n=1 Tax=Vibrio parahaemolyticus TaxID=670 RepID=UPI00301BB247